MTGHVADDRASRQSPSRLIAVFAALAVLYGLVRPASADVPVGTSAADFLDFEVGARSAAMGGAQVGSADGVTAQFWNPSGLATLDRPQVGGMHASWLEDLKYEWIGYARPLGPKLGVGSVGVTYFHLPSIQGMDEFGSPTGQFRVYDLAVTVGLARPIVRGLALGANAKLIRQSLATVSGTGAAVDLGATATVAGATIGAVVQNLGPGVSFGGPSYPLPSQVRFGASRPFLDSRLTLAADYNMPRDYFRDFRIGTEVKPHENIALRLGYRQEIGTTNDPATGFSYGLGVNWKQLNVDYAMTPNEEFSDVHRFSFGYSFGSGPSAEEQKEPERKEEPPPPPAPTVIASKPAPKPAAKKEAPPAATTAREPEPQASAAAEPKRAASKASEFAVVLPGYPSKDSAKAEIRALELLGFRINDAEILHDTKRGYYISLARVKNKGRAEEMVTSLSRMSFRAQVELVEK